MGDARYIRIIPMAWQGRISMRAGVLVRTPSLFPYKLFGKGNFFGEKEVLLGPAARLATVRCESDGRLLVLSKQDLCEGGSGLALLSEFPEFKTPLCSVGFFREMHRKKLLSAHSAKRSYRHLAAWMIQ